MMRDSRVIALGSTLADWAIEAFLSHNISCNKHTNLFSAKHHGKCQDKVNLVQNNDGSSDYF